MTIYTIRQGFTITLGNTIYIGGENVDLTASEFELHKHKLEGVESTVIPIVQPYLETYGEQGYLDSELNMILSSQIYSQGVGSNKYSGSVTDFYLKRYNGAIQDELEAFALNRSIVLVEASCSCEPSSGATIEFQYYDLDGANGQIIKTLALDLEGDRFGFFENEKLVIPARKRIAFFANGTLLSPQLIYYYRKVLADLNV